MSSKPKFQFTPMDKAPDPELGAERIPVDRYTNPAFLKLEDEKIWSKTWLLGERDPWKRAGHDSRSQRWLRLPILDSVDGRAGTQDRK